MTWIITGGSGQLGTALARELTSKGISQRSFNSEEIDITNVKEIEKITACSPSIIVNCAAWTDVDGAESHKQECNSINIDGALNLARFSKALQIPFIQISTDYVFSGDRDKPWEANEPTNPTSIYGQSKAEAERMIQEMYPDGSCIMRTAWLYSPWRKNFAKTILKRAVQNLPSKVVNDQYGQPTSAIALASKIFELFSEKPHYGIYHGTNSGTCTWFDFAREIYYLLGKDPELVSAVNSGDFPIKAQRPKYSVLSHEMWKSRGIQEMNDWRVDLKSVFPEILQEVERELADA